MAKLLCIIQNALFLSLVFLISGCNPSTDNLDGRSKSKDDSWRKKEILFEYGGQEDWRDKWFLDGTRATIATGANGMEFSAGKENKNDTCHAVLWTRESFNGNILIEYDYTRTDTSETAVNIIYFLATGSATEDFPSDVYDWRAYREVPTMS